MTLFGRADAGRNHEQKCDPPLAHQTQVRRLFAESNRRL